MTERKKELLAKQYELVRTVIEDANINIVTCGMCGSVVLHKIESEEIECYDCNFISEPCDFPDLFY
jgi:hypothetical protein